MPYKDPDDYKEWYDEQKGDPNFLKARAKYFRAWRKSHPESYKATQKSNSENRKANGKANAYRRKYRKLPWVRTRESIKTRLKQARQGKYKCKAYIDVKCMISVAELKELWERDKGWELKNPSIDRKDRNGHYTKENCHYIEMSENRKRVQRGKFPFKSV